MSGIAGLFFEHGADTNTAQRITDKMLQVIKHRGRSVASPAVVKDNCSLGYLGDKNSGQCFESNGVVAVFSGELYNHLDLKTELINRGQRFQTKSYAEAVVRTYLVYGRIFVEKLKGVFAIALYDRGEHVFILCRDKIGICPLYYCAVNQGSFSSLAFASEIKALLSIQSKESITINKEVLCQYMHFQHYLDDRTLFNGISRVNPGEMLIFNDPCNYGKSTYWSLNSTYFRDTSAYYTESYYKDNLLSILHKVVRKQIPADKSFGAYVSGGMDSSTVASIVSEYVSPFNLFSGRYDFPKYDESSYVQALVKHLSLEDKTTIITLSEDDIISSLKDAIYHIDEPCAGPGLVGQFALAKKICESHPNIDVLFTGEGGDELFGGYARYIVAYLESCIYGAIYPVNRDYVMTLDKLAPIMPILQGYESMIKSFFTGNIFGSKERRYFDLLCRFPKNCLSQEFRNSVFSVYEEGIFNDFQSIFAELGSVSYFTKMTYFDFKTALQALLQVDDRVNGAFGLSSRTPLLDEELVEFAFSVPPKYKFLDGYSKGLLRKTMAGMLPDEILYRRSKMGFPLPMQEWIDADGKIKEFILELFKSDFYKDVFGKPVDKLVFNRSLWGKMSLCLWSDIFKIGL